MILFIVIYNTFVRLDVLRRNWQLNGENVPFLVYAQGIITFYLYKLRYDKKICKNVSNEFFWRALMDREIESTSLSKYLVNAKECAAKNQL